MLAGDMNAYLGDWRFFLGSACPLHDKACCELQGGTCNRGRMLWSTMHALDFHILNGCTNIATDTLAQPASNGGQLYAYQ